MRRENDPVEREREIAKQDLEKEEKTYDDDPETIRKAREWDEFKDGM